MRLLFIAIVVYVLAIVFAAIPRSHAHDHARPDLKSWFENLHSGKGPCCDGSEAQYVDDADWESSDGHYRVRIEGEWVDVPDEAVVDGPNRAGPTMAWFYYVNGSPVVRCFMPGSGA